MLALEQILVATDFGEASDVALSYGRELARRFGATLHVVHVAADLASHAAAVSGLPLDLGRMQSQLEDDARETLSRLVSTQDREALRAKPIVLTSSTPAHAILSYARDAHVDLIVVGTHGRTGLSHLLLGSVAERVVRSATCPVLTVRPHERDFVHADALQRVTAQ
jgi:nucleotide-binding universal stress UspA family protein